LFGPGAAPGSWDGSKRLVREGYVQNTVNEWHGPDRSLVAIALGRAFWVVGSCVVCVAGSDGSGGEGAGDRPPEPWKWSQMPRIDGGNVTSSLGGYDRALPRQEITAEQLDRFVTPVCSEHRSDEPLARLLQTRLDAQITQVLDGHPWAPWVVELGIAHEETHFRRTGDTLRIVAMALPYLSAAVRERAGDFLDGLCEQGVPLDQSLFSADGRRREYYDLSPPVRAALAARPPSSQAALWDVYALWAYAQYHDRWDLALALLPAIRRELADELAASLPSELAEIDGETIAQMNRQIAGLIGYERLLARAGDAPAALSARQHLAAWMTARVHLEKADSRLQTRIGHHARIPRYEDLVPELSSALAHFAGADLQRNAEDLNRELPVWYQAWSERLIGGENYISPPALSRGLFAIMADGLESPPEQLKRYLDQPWCRGDLYYAEKLTSLLRRMERP
jgi:hypothetical protein